MVQLICTDRATVRRLAIRSNRRWCILERRSAAMGQTGVTTDLDGSTVVITGASSGIGAATARALSACGAKVLLACRSESRAAPVVDELVAAETARLSRRLFLRCLRYPTPFKMVACPVSNLCRQIASDQMPVRRPGSACRKTAAITRSQTSSSSSSRSW